MKKDGKATTGYIVLKKSELCGVVLNILHCMIKYSVIIKNCFTFLGILSSILSSLSKSIKIFLDSCTLVKISKNERYAVSLLSETSNSIIRHVRHMSSFAILALRVDINLISKIVVIDERIMIANLYCKI